LQHYFEALHDLAAFGSAKKDDSSPKKSSAAAKKPSTTSKQLQATSDLTQLIGHLTTERYQQSHLIKILRAADPDVAAITEMLEQTASTQYKQELGVEEKDTQDVYFRFGKTDARQNTALLFLLDRSYRDDMDNIAKRRREADAYTAGLSKLREAHHQLTVDAGSHDRKKLFSEAYDYGGQLETLGEDVRAAR
jgi:hypothetical protein